MMEKKFKCLVIMHNQLNEKTNNGKTVLSMLSKVPKKDLALLYITKTSSDNSNCGTSFHIGEKEQLLRMLGKVKRKSVASNQFQEQTELGQKSRYPKLISSLIRSNTRSGLALTFRNYLWSYNKWKSKELDNWVKDFAPDIIFVLPGYIEGVMDCALCYADAQSIPIVSFVTDDYFTNIKSWNILKRMLYRRLYKKYYLLSKAAKLHYVIGEKMAKKYNRYFDCDNHLIMNSVDIKNKPTDYDIGEKPQFLFAGNIGLGRAEQLIRLAKALEVMNASRNMHAILNIYTPLAIDNNIKSKINDCACCAYKGSVYGDELNFVISNADVLVHVESFNRKYRKLLETALSTKIPECMNAGKQILVIGPKYSASIEYVKEHKSGYCITDQNDATLPNEIYEMLQDSRSRHANTLNAWHQVSQHHSKEKNSLEVYEKMMQLSLNI